MKGMMISRSIVAKKMFENPEGIQIEVYSDHDNTLKIEEARYDQLHDGAASAHMSLNYFLNQGNDDANPELLVQCPPSIDLPKSESKNLVLLIS